MHAMIRCPHSRALRDALRKEWKLPEDDLLLHLKPEGLIMFLFSINRDEAARLLLILWQTWQKYWTELCFVRHSSNHFDEKGKQLVFDFLKLNWVDDKPKKKGEWTLPESGSVKAAVGVIIKDDSGQVLLSAWKYIYASFDPKEIEVLAYKKGLSLAME
ncbi:hypothetical protein BS78_06G257800 [Paspalum vaginatum]|nr:hypothetical protein BS78_06G257800 [Paspalum vaginatum]